MKKFFTLLCVFTLVLSICAGTVASAVVVTARPTVIAPRAPIVTPKISPTPKAPVKVSPKAPAKSGSIATKPPRIVNPYSPNNNYNAYYVSRGYYGNSMLGYIWSAYFLGRVCAVDRTNNTVVVEQHNYGNMVLAWGVTLLVVGVIVAVIIRKRRNNSLD